MSQSIDLSTILKQNGQSLTKQRSIVFDALRQQDPLTMRELSELIKGQIDRASLYRTIALFERLGIVSRVTIGWKYKLELSDQFSEHHHHLTCLKCQTVIAISEHDLEAIIGQLASIHKFQPVDHQIEIQGYCNQCQMAAATN